MKTVIAPYPERLAAVAREVGVRIVPAEAMSVADMDVAEFYVPEFSMRHEPLELMAALPSLKVVQTLTAGVEHYLPWIPDGITLCSGGGIHDTSVAEHAITLALSALRDIPQFVIDGQTHTWHRRAVGSLADKVVTVVGAGSIGNALLARLEPFECTVRSVARTPREGVFGIDQLNSLLEQSDVVFLCLPASPDTHHLMDERRLDLLPEGALIVNVGRASTVDQGALVDRLSRGRLRAALDVVDPEPLDGADSLWGSGALITPHVAGNSPAFLPRAIALVQDQLRRWAGGHALRNVVSKEHR